MAFDIGRICGKYTSSSSMLQGFTSLPLPNIKGLMVRLVLKAIKVSR